jgi:hypothetical protein
MTRHASVARLELAGKWSPAITRRDGMTKLDAALLKLEGALDQTVDPRVRTLIDVAQQAIEGAKQVMEERLAHA